MGFFSKSIRVFSGLQINDKNPLHGEELDQVLIGSIYASQQAAYLNSYESGMNAGDRATIVNEYFGVQNHEEALETLSGLLHRNDDPYLNVVYEAYESGSNYDAILRAGVPNEEGAYEYYLDLYKELAASVPSILEQKVVPNFAEFKKYKTSGWNCGRCTFMARLFHEMGYISAEEMKHFIAQSYSVLKKYCNNWPEYVNSYVAGRQIWGGTNNGGMASIGADLLSNDKSPLKGKIAI